MNSPLAYICISSKYIYSLVLLSLKIPQFKKKKKSTPLNTIKTLVKTFENWFKITFLNVSVAFLIV